MYLFDGLFGGLLIQFKWITTYYCLYTLFTLCFLLSVFLFFFFFPSARTNLAKVVDKKQSTHDATAIGKLQTQYSVSIIVVTKYQSNISFWQSTNFAKLELHPFVFTWAVTKTAISSHSFASFCNLFLIKGNPLSVTPKKIIETSFGLFGIRIIQEANIMITTRKVTKEVQRSVTPNVYLLSCFIF